MPERDAPHWPTPPQRPRTLREQLEDMNKARERFRRGQDALKRWDGPFNVRRWDGPFNLGKDQ